MVLGAVNYLFTFDCGTLDLLTVHAMSTLYLAGGCFPDGLWNRVGLYDHDSLFTVAILLQDRARFTAQPTTSPLWYLAEELGNYFLSDRRYRNRLTTHLLDVIDPLIILPIFTKEGMRPFAIMEILTHSPYRGWRPERAQLKLLIDFRSSIELDYKSWEDTCRAKGFLLTCVYHTCEFWEQNLRDVVTSLNIARTSFRRKFVDTSVMNTGMFSSPLVQLDYPEAVFEADCDLCKIFLQYGFDES